MTSWSDRRVLELFGIEAPLVLAPMAGFGTAALAVAVSRAGGLGSIACASLSTEQADAAIAEFRRDAGGPINTNFFCHASPPDDPHAMAVWRARLVPYHVELGLDPSVPLAGAVRRPFDEAWCAWLERVRPEVVSFHFGLPPAALLARVQATGARVIASATTVREAVWLEAQGCAAVIAQGAEAGGHRAMFLTDEVSQQVGLIALVPQVVDAVRVPVIAAGGLGDGRGIAAALALGASAVQLGTAFLRCPEANVSAIHRRALEAATDDATAITNVMTGRPARGITNRVMREHGPLNPAAPAFPLGAAPLAALRARAEANGADDFTTLWAGQAAALGRAVPAFELTQALLREARAGRA